VVFCNDDSVHVDLCTRLNEAGWPSSVISGPLNEKEHDIMMRALLSFHIRILITTDRTSLSIDLERINFTISLDVPQEFYALLFRVGRTSRFGIYGLSILIGTEQEFHNVNSLCEPYQVKFNLVPEPISSDLYTFIRKEEIEESPEDEKNETKKDVAKIPLRSEKTLKTEREMKPSKMLPGHEQKNKEKTQVSKPEKNHIISTNYTNKTVTALQNIPLNFPLIGVTNSNTSNTNTSHVYNSNNSIGKLNHIDSNPLHDTKKLNMRLSDPNNKLQQFHDPQQIQQQQIYQQQQPVIEELDMDILDILRQNGWPPSLPLSSLLDSEEWCQPPTLSVKKRIKKWRQDVCEAVTKEEAVISRYEDTLHREPMGLISKIPPCYIAPLAEVNRAESFNSYSNHPQLMEKSFHYLLTPNEMHSNYYYYDGIAEKKPD
jgi:hypothetical protein